MMVLVCAISGSTVSSQVVNAAPQELSASVAEIRQRNKITGLVRESSNALAAKFSVVIS